MAAEQVTDFKPREVAHHVKFLGAFDKRLQIIQFFFNLFKVIHLHDCSNDNNNRKTSQEANFSQDVSVLEKCFYFNLIYNDEMKKKNFLLKMNFIFWGAQSLEN